MPDAEDSPEGEGDEAPGIAAAYIASLADELAQLARRKGFDALGYILDMARLEADEISKHVGRKDGNAGPNSPNAPN